MAMSFKDLQRNMLNLDRGSSAAKAEMARDVFFDGREDVPVERLARRVFQDQREKDFINKFTKPVGGEGVTGLLQLTPDAPRTLVQEKERLAKMYGPTLREIGGDFMAGLGSIAKDFNPISFIPGANMLMSGINAARDIFFPPPPVVNYGGSVKGTVTEESPMTTGVINVLPDTFFVPFRETLDRLGL
tara:strand:+ start:351 stop:914 length:564 start_codon:yes stop_codon:yes gene_type:complete